MQGVQDFGDYGIELRIKMKTNPGEQFVMKRKAFVMIRAAFELNGITIPLPSVHVIGGDGSSAASAAARTVAGRRRPRCPHSRERAGRLSSLREAGGGEPDAEADEEDAGATLDPVHGGTHRSGAGGERGGGRGIAHINEDAVEVEHEPQEDEGENLVVGFGRNELRHEGEKEQRHLGVQRVGGEAAPENLAERAAGRSVAPSAAGLADISMRKPR